MTTTKQTSARKAPVKAPADRKPPAPKVRKTDDGRYVTVDGLELYIANEAVDDFELLDLMAQAERNQDPSVLPELLRRFVGEDGYRKTMDHLRKNGRVRIEDAVGFVNRLMAALNPNS